MIMYKRERELYYELQVSEPDEYLSRITGSNACVVTKEILGVQMHGDRAVLWKRGKCTSDIGKFVVFDESGTTGRSDGKYILTHDGTLLRRVGEPLTEEENILIFHYNDGRELDGIQRIQRILYTKYVRVQQILPSDHRVSEPYKLNHDLLPTGGVFDKHVGVTSNSNIDVLGGGYEPEKIGELFSKEYIDFIKDEEKGCWKQGYLYGPNPSTS